MESRHRMRMHIGRWAVAIGLGVPAVLWLGAGTLAADGATDAAAGLGPLRGVTVGIDAGHNGGNYRHPNEIARLVPAGGFRKACDTTGTAARNGYSEAAFTLDVARRLRRLVESEGGTVVMTRTSNRGWGPCINRRARITNRSNVAVSIHADGSLGAGDRGFHVIVPARRRGYTDDIVVESTRLGRAVRRALRSGTPIPPANYIGQDGIDVRGDLGGLNLSNVPKVFVEAGNMRHPADVRTLGSAAGRQRIARSIAEGIAAWRAG